MRLIPRIIALIAIIFTSFFVQGCSESNASTTPAVNVPEATFHAVPSLDEQLFLDKLRREIGMGDKFGNTILLMVGPFSSFEDLTLNGEIIHIDPDFRSLAYVILKNGNYYITFDHSFYDELTLQERLFVIAHEVWHAKKYSKPNTEINNQILIQIPMEALRSEVESDFFAAKYVDPEVIRNFLFKYCNNKNELGWRVWALFKLQQEKRGLDP